MTHAQCLLEHGSCPTPGCGECDPLQEPVPSVRGALARIRDRLKGKTVLPTARGLAIAEALEEEAKKRVLCRHVFTEKTRICRNCGKTEDEIWEAEKDPLSPRPLVSAVETVKKLVGDLKESSRKRDERQKRKLIWEVVGLIIAVIIGILGAIAKSAGG